MYVISIFAMQQRQQQSVQFKSS